MRRTILGLFGLLVATTAILAQGGAPTPPAAAGTEYFPLKKGSTWIYKLNDIEVTVKAGETKNGETKLETLSNGKVVASEDLKIDANGVYRTKINNAEIKDPVKIFELKDGKPAAKGAKWAVKSKIQNQDVTGEFEVKDDKASVKILGTDYANVVAVEGAKLVVAGTETTVKYWFAPNKGIIKLSYTINGQEAVLELKSFEEGK